MNTFFIYVQKNGEFLTGSESSTTRNIGVAMQNSSCPQEDAEKADGKDKS